MFNYLILILILVCHSVAREAIEDIPIESYEFAEIGDNDMDLELVPKRRAKSLQYEEEYEDPKESYFHFLKSSGELNDIRQGRSGEVPKPGGFTSDLIEKRSKRSTEVDKKIKGLEKELGKPLELLTLDTNTTNSQLNDSSLNKSNANSTVENRNDSNESGGRSGKDLLINDFIRFKRETTTIRSEKKEGNIETMDDSNSKQSHSEKMLFDPNNVEGNREPRGLTKEEWIKQVYPVRRSDDYDDSLPASSENIRAPRVHFVTQRRSETVPAPNYRAPPPPLYEREARGRSLGRDFPRDLSRDLSRETDYYYQPRYTRHYNPGPGSPPLPPVPPPYRYDNYYRYDSPRDLYDRVPDNYYLERGRNYNSNRQRRIIYYATLPDVSRTPPNVDLRDRYNYYRDRYDDRYAGINDPYLSFRRGYPKRYDDNERTKSTYPVKVSTDVNVRDIKKNPEKRIYSEVDRNRYAYKPSTYQNERN